MCCSKGLLISIWARGSCLNQKAGYDFWIDEVKWWTFSRVWKRTLGRGGYFVGRQPNSFYSLCLQKKVIAMVVEHHGELWVNLVSHNTICGIWVDCNQITPSYTYRFMDIWKKQHCFPHQFEGKTHTIVLGWGTCLESECAMGCTLVFKTSMWSTTLLNPTKVAL